MKNNTSLFYDLKTKHGVEAEPIRAVTVSKSELEKLGLENLEQFADYAIQDETTSIFASQKWSGMTVLCLIHRP